MHCRCPHRLNLSFQSSRSCALPNIKLLKDKDLEFSNSIYPEQTPRSHRCFPLANGKFWRGLCPGYRITADMHVPQSVTPRGCEAGQPRRAGKVLYWEVPPSCEVQEGDGLL